MSTTTPDRSDTEADRGRGDAPRRSIAPVVTVEDLRKTYDAGSLRRKRRVEALCGVTLQANPGEVFGLLGPNGAGKTTMIKILLGVIGASGGRASLFGMPAGSPAARRRVGYLPESLKIDRHHTARSALRYYGRLSGLSHGEISQRSDGLLELVGLHGRTRESVRRFSKGMLQRLGLAQALMHDPDLLVLDEPTDGLDPVGRSEVRKVIDRLSGQGKTIFLNSHILHEVELVCSHLAIMAGGRILASGTLDQLRHGDSDGITAILRVAAAKDTAGPDGSDARAVAEKLRGIIAEVSGRPAGEAITPAGEIEGRHLLDFHVRLTDQVAVDALIDRLRASAYSILSLQRHRRSLEDTFMQLVTQASVPADSGAINGSGSPAFSGDSD